VSQTTRIAARVAVAIVAAVLVSPALALADACHVGPPLETLGLGLHASIELEAASYDNSRGEGTYLGAMIGIAYRRDWLRVRAQLPGYRLRRNSETFIGPGDLLLGTEVALLRDADDTFAAGIGVAATLPTGDASSDLGMGHVMLMPGLWGEVTRDRTFAQLQIVYGRSLGSHESHEEQGHAGHHAHSAHVMGPGPIVNPMNASEIAGRASAGYRLVDWLRVRAGVDGAVPVADDQGESRAIAVLGLDLLPDPFNAAVEGQVPFIGDPFTVKAVVAVGLRF
jgi:hypothetical protein